MMSVSVALSSPLSCTPLPHTGKAVMSLSQGASSYVSVFEKEIDVCLL